MSRACSVLAFTVLAACGEASSFVDAAPGGDDVDAAVAPDATPPDATPPDADDTAPLTSCDLPAVPPQAVAIIESTSANSGHTMDAIWQTVATEAGHTATILPQSALADLAQLDGYDVLVVSSGVIAIDATQIATIAAFAASGRGVFVQGEYQPTYTTNVAFEQIAAAHGAAVDFTSEVSGTLDPVLVLGCWASHPEAVAAITGHWYGATGSWTAAAGLEALTVDDTVPVGFALCTQGATRTLIAMTTDQDFVLDNTANAHAFMRNVLARLAFASRCYYPAPAPR